MNSQVNPSHMLFALFLFLGTALIASAMDPAHFLAGGIYMVCSLAIILLC